MAESDEDARLLGRIAVAQKFVTPAQVEHAMRERAQSGGKLGAILLGGGMIDARQLGVILALQKRHRANSPRRRPGGQNTPLHGASTPQPDGRHRLQHRLTTPPDAPPEAISGEGRSGSFRARQLQHRLAASEALPRRRQGTPQVVPPVRGLQLSDRAAFDERVRQRRAAPQPRSSRPSAPAGRQPRSSRPSAPDRQPHSSRPSSPAPTSVTPPARADPARTTTLPDSPRARQDAPPSQRTRTVPDSPRAQGAMASPQRHNTVPASPRALDVGTSHVAAETLNTPSQPPARRWSVTPPAAKKLPELEPLPWSPPAPTLNADRLNTLLSRAVQLRASDVHIHAGIAPKMRIFGSIVNLDDTPLDAEQSAKSLRAILTPWQLARLDEHGEVDLAYTIKKIGRFRANIYQHHAGCNGVFHVVPALIPSLSSLGLPASLAKLTDFSQGIILATGPTGCGKTSTLAALVDIINKGRDDHIITIEDPIEYLHESRRCIVNQRQVGRHTESFARGLRGALREDPDIICIGELRDLETVSLAMSAAETGHLVLATLHTGSAIGTINRIVGAYPPGQQPQVRSMLSESLRAVISQRLLPLADGSGVVVALEILYITKAVANLIRDNRTFQIVSAMQTGRAHGMQRLDDSLKELLASGRIKRETALLNCTDPRALGAGR